MLERLKLTPTVRLVTALLGLGPLGATLGDMLTKPVASGGLALSRVNSSVILAVLMTPCVFCYPERQGPILKKLKGLKG